MRLSDLITEFIASSLQDDGSAELSRAQLAERFNCVPSQINYVIATRFSPEHGYVVESKRGGGGYIRITRVTPTGSGILMHAVNSIGDTLSFHSAAAILRNLADIGILSEKAARIILAAVSPAALTPAPEDVREKLRATIVKQALVVIGADR